MGGHLFAGNNGDDTWKLLSFRRVDAFDPRVCVHAARDCHVQHSGKHDIVYVSGRPGHKTRVFLSLHSLTDITLRHG